MAARSAPPPREPAQAIKVRAAGNAIVARHMPTQALGNNILLASKLGFSMGAGNAAGTGGGRARSINAAPILAPNLIQNMAIEGAAQLRAGAAAAAAQAAQTSADLSALQNINPGLFSPPAAAAPAAGASIGDTSTPAAGPWGAGQPSAGDFGQPSPQAPDDTSSSSVDLPTFAGTLADAGVDPDIIATAYQTAGGDAALATDQQDGDITPFLGAFASSLQEQGVDQQTIIAAYQSAGGT